ncbi:uncharacterized protein [Procambarus clarkii]|uniref:uncharacterized protein n=1 Tax=Procambarus clarkii TaxID=6728 RepID=UPI0037437529
MVMCDMLHIPVEAIYGVELVTAHRVVLKFVREEEYRDFLRRYEGRTLPLPGGAGSVAISDRSGALTYAPAAPVNLFREEDFPPLPLEDYSEDEEVAIPLAAAASPASHDMPPVVAVPPPGIVVPSFGLPAPVTVPTAPVGLPGAHCEASPSSPSSSAAAPGPVSAPRVPAMLGAGVAAEPPAVCGQVPPVVEAAAVLSWASVRPASGTHVSGSA